jgi:hypothetical protein
MSPRLARPDTHALFAGALALGSAAAFYVPALRATHGDWPIPLDDTFIHFDFARAAAQLHPFEWIAGQGYSSGETSPLYALLLAPGYALGFHGLWLGLWAALLAVLSLVLAMRAVRELVKPCPQWVPLLGALLLVSVGVLDWTFWSGMEGAVVSAALAIALVRAKRAREAPPTERRRAAWRVGAWGAVVVALRPEAFVIIPLLAVVVARRALSQSATGTLGRCAAPAVLLLLVFLGTNRVLTGDAASAGALAKMLAYRPFLSSVDRATGLAENLVHFGLLLYRQLGQRTGFAWLLPGFSVFALVHRRTSALAFLCIGGALLWSFVVAGTTGARFQNYRYFMPSLTLLLYASTLGISAVARSRRWSRLGGPLGVMAVLLPATGIPEQIEFFANASENIHDQQVETGKRLAQRMAPGLSVLVGDAGAIPYISGHAAVDALGLGGFDHLPFARAALLGEGATVELIEHLPPERRPAFLAIYPTWFGEIAHHFGREIDHVSLEHNFICGGLSKGIYEADWSSLTFGPSEPPMGGTVVDTLDVADVVSEKDHEYVSPEPGGGWSSFDVRKDAHEVARFDAGRLILEGQVERFRVLGDGARIDAIWIRTDEQESLVETRVLRGTVELDRVPLGRQGIPALGSWGTVGARFHRPVRRGDILALRALSGDFRAFHVWLVTQS